MDKIKIAVDMDEVVYDLFNSWVSLYRRKSGDQESIPRRRTWRFTDEMPKMSEEEALDILNDPQVFTIGAEVPGTRTAMFILNLAGFDIYFLTNAKFKSALNQKYNWLKKQDYGFKAEDKIIATTDMSLKAAISSSFDVVIDDCPYLFMNNDLHCAHRILFGYEYNKICPDDRIDFRAETWNDIVLYLTRAYGVDLNEAVKRYKQE